jgi:hypothetical protein
MALQSRQRGRPVAFDERNTGPYGEHLLEARQRLFVAVKRQQRHAAVVPHFDIVGFKRQRARKGLQRILVPPELLQAAPMQVERLRLLELYPCGRCQ